MALVWCVHAASSKAHSSILRGFALGDSLGFLDWKSRDHNCTEQVVWDLEFKEALAFRLLQGLNMRVFRTGNGLKFWLAISSASGRREKSKIANHGPVKPSRNLCPKKNSACQELLSLSGESNSIQMSACKPHPATAPVSSHSVLERQDALSSTCCPQWFSLYNGGAE